MQQLIRFRSKNELVYDALRKAIIRGEFQPGARLIIDDLAASLGVSPIPVREALRQLEGDGFVAIEPYIGAVVTEMHAAMICEVFGLLGALEGISGAAACLRMTEADFASMADLLRRMDAALSAPDVWSRHNIAFHLSICDHAKTPLIKSTMAKALDHWDRLRNHYVKGVFLHRIEVAQQDHWRMYAALRARDYAAFKRITEAHNQDALSAYTSYLQAEGYIDPASGDGCVCPE